MDKKIQNIVDKYNSKIYKNYKKELSGVVMIAYDDEDNLIEFSDGIVRSAIIHCKDLIISTAFVPFKNLTKQQKLQILNIAHDIIRDLAKLEEDKYYLKLNTNGIGDAGYLVEDRWANVLILGGKFGDGEYDQHKFTEKEIQELVDKYNINLDIFEKILVN